MGFKKRIILSWVKQCKHKKAHAKESLNSKFTNQENYIKQEGLFLFYPFRLTFIQQQY